MPDDDTPSDRRTVFGRRRLLAATTGTALLPVGRAAAADPVPVSSDDAARDRPRDAARTYVEALDAGDRTAANELIAPGGPLDEWSVREFEWVSSFDIDLLSFERVARRDGDVVADLELSVAGNPGTVRYRFRRVAGEWTVWAAVDGLRSTADPAADAAAVAEAYVAALDAGNREAANALIADGADLPAWTPREFDWVGPFEFEFVGFRAVAVDDVGVTGEIELAIADESRTVRYRFRESDAGTVELWAPVDGLRTTGDRSAEAVAAAYVAALDAGDIDEANRLIADAGRLDRWSAREFRWVDAFDFELVDFETVRRSEESATADLTVRLGGSTESVRYEFRRLDVSEWRLWDAPAGLR